MVELLLLRGADVNASAEPAVSKGDLETIEALVVAGADLNGAICFRRPGRRTSIRSARVSAVIPELVFPASLAAQEKGSPGKDPSVRLLERYRFGSVVSLPQSMPDHSTRS